MSRRKIRRTSGLSIFKALAFVLSILMIIGYDWLPERIVKIYPHENATLSIYSDEDAGGESQASWINQAQSHFQCDVKKSKQTSYCGGTITWSNPGPKSLDLTSYQQLLVDIKHQGSSPNLVVYLYNKTKQIKGIVDTDDAKNITSTIRSDEFSRPVKIRFSDFKVADWWISKHNIPREYAHVERDKIISMGIAPTVYLDEQRDVFQINTVYIQGTYFSKEQLYAALLIFWAALLIGEGIFHYIALHKRISRDAKRLQSLSATNEQYKVKSETDKLTGLRNREGLAQALQLMENNKNQLALLLVDVDFFKKINDNYGHDIGDIVLEELASLLQQSTRSKDLVGRWGGEEFIILLHIEKPQDAELFAEKIRLQISAVEFARDLKLHLSISIGLAFMTNEESFDISFKRADQALYKAKRNGRNLVEIAN